MVRAIFRMRLTELMVGKVKLPALTGGGSDMRQCFAAGSVPVK
jgi:hypothetical protein